MKIINHNNWNLEDTKKIIQEQSICGPKTHENHIEATTMLKRKRGKKGSFPSEKGGQIRVGEKPCQHTNPRTVPLGGKGPSNGRCVKSD